MPEGCGHPKEARNSKPPAPVEVARQAEGRILSMMEKRKLEEALLEDAGGLCQAMRGTLGDFVRFHIFSSWNVLQLQTLEALFHLLMLLKISYHVLILWSVALV
jgi:hypothetical protein